MNKSELPLAFKLTRSRYYSWLLFLILILGMVSITLASIPVLMSVLSLLILGFITGSSAYKHRYVEAGTEFLLYPDHAIRMTSLEKEVWCGKWIDYVNLGPLVVLKISNEVGRKRTLVLWKDMVTDEVWRRLQIKIRHTFAVISHNENTRTPLN